MDQQPVTLDDVNSLEYDSFISLFGNVVEHCALCAAAVWADRPFSDVGDLMHKISRFIDEQPITGKQGILRCHPDLAGRLATSGGLTAESTNEQRQAGLTDMNDSERQFLNENNKRYKEKFGFPFVICARENKKVAILKGIAERLQNDEMTELLTGIEEVKKICYLRLCDKITEKSAKL